MEKKSKDREVKQTQKGSWQKKNEVENTVNKYWEIRVKNLWQEYKTEEKKLG